MDSMKVIKFHISRIRNVLLKLIEISDNPK